MPLPFRIGVRQLPIEPLEEYRDAGCTHIVVGLWGENRHDQIRLFGEQVLPKVRPALAGSSA